MQNGKRSTGEKYQHNRKQTLSIEKNRQTKRGDKDAVKNWEGLMVMARRNIRNGRDHQGANREKKKIENLQYSYY